MPRTAMPRVRKRFGQHFLTDRGYLARLATLIAPQAGDTMVEIGPGAGALTAELLPRLGRLHAVEIDRDLAAQLRERWPASRLVVHEGDVLDFDFARLPAPLRVVGNLPYNISTPILFRVAESADRLRDAIFMLQREVVERMVATPGSAQYGRLSVMLQYRFSMALAFRVPAGAFSPPPKVESAVVRIVPLDADRPRARDDAHFAQVVASAFSHRRKTLRNALKALGPAEAFAAGGVDLARRGETLSVAEFVALSDAAVPIAGR